MKIALAIALVAMPASALAFQDTQPVADEAAQTVPTEDAQPAPDESAMPAPDEAALPAPAEPMESLNDFDLAQAKIDACPGERFDFVVPSKPGVNGTNVGLCSVAGASNQDIAAMLRSAIGQLESTDRMAAETRDQLVVLIRAKLSEVEAR